MDGLVEVAGASSDLHADGKSTVEPAGVAGLDEQVGPEVMLCVGDRSPVDPLEVGRDVVDTSPACLLLRRSPHHAPWIAVTIPTLPGVDGSGLVEQCGWRCSAEAASRQAPLNHWAMTRTASSA